MAGDLLDLVFSGEVMIVLGFAVACLAILVLAYKPRTGVLVALALKPFVDMFWWSKVQAGLSPLHLMGVGVPAIALIGIWRSKPAPRPSPLDRVVLLYLALLTFSTVFKMVTAPEHAVNAVDAYLRLLSVTSFYWIGKQLFVGSRDKRLLVACLIGSLVIPFGTTLFQQGFSIRTVHSDDVFAANPEAKSNEVSGFYLGARHGIQRISGAYEGVYELAFLGVVSVILGLALLEAEDVKRGAVCWLLLLVGGYFLYFTYSRSAWIASMGTILLCQFFRRRLALALGILSVCVMLFFLNETVHHRFEDEVGAVTGTSEFGRLGYGRGFVWKRTMRDFHKWPIEKQLLGGFGIGNPENQFLNMLVFFGYVGLAGMLIMMCTATLTLLAALARLPRERTYLNNTKLLFGCMIVVCYWFAGLGNGFNVQISIQWVLWTWTGLIVADDFQLGRKSRSTGSTWRRSNPTRARRVRTSQQRPRPAARPMRT